MTGLLRPQLLLQYYPTSWNNLRHYLPVRDRVTTNVVSWPYVVTYLTSRSLNMSVASERVGSACLTLLSLHDVTLCFLEDDHIRCH